MIDDSLQGILSLMCLWSNIFGHEKGSSNKHPLHENEVFALTMTFDTLYTVPGRYFFIMLLGLCVVHE
jgi:hypothetical protein